MVDGKNYSPIKVAITEDMILKANKRDQGAYNTKSFMGGGGNMVGFLGEYLFHEVCPHFEHVDTFGFDFRYKQYTVDVKSKNQNITTEPKGYYEGSVPLYQINQQHPEWYVFCRLCKIDGVYSYGWVLGKITHKRLLEDGRVVEEGQDEGNMKFKVGNVNIRYDQLDPIRPDYRYVRSVDSV